MTRQYDPRMEEFAESDAFLDALSRGDDVSGGTDPLAAALLGLKADIDRPMPPAPVLDAGADTTVRRDGGNGEVASLDAARAKRRTANPWVAGLIGAAAGRTRGARASLKCSLRFLYGGRSLSSPKVDSPCSPSSHCPACRRSIRPATRRSKAST